jgi:hypothetical protein
MSIAAQRKFPPDAAPLRFAAQVKRRPFGGWFCVQVMEIYG